MGCWSLVLTIPKRPGCWTSTPLKPARIAEPMLQDMREGTILLADRAYDTKTRVTFSLPSS